MKQHITKEQFNELTPEQYDKFMDVITSWTFEEYEITIGHMIEFLGDDLDSIKHDGGVTEGDKWIIYWGVQVNNEHKTSYGDKELADALWEAVKEKLCQK